MRFYTVKEVSTLLRTSPKTVRNWLAAGQLAGGVRPGKHWLVREEAIAALIQAPEAIDRDRQGVGR